ncbi:sigma-70 family RNA polymerase sigma factor [Rhodanobacter koreensis]
MEADEFALWERWCTSKDVAARDALIVKYSPWTRLVARDVYVRVYALRDAWHDCVQNALIGLLEAMDRFDPARGVSFQSYARHRVRGAVFNGVRTLRESLAQGTRSYDQMAAALDRMEIFDDESTTDPLEAFVSTTVGLGLGFLLEASSVPSHAQGSDAYSELEREELSTAMAEAIERLPEREQMILVMHYYHHVPFVEISAQLGVTKGRISQLHKRALDHLRMRLRNRITMDC